MKFPSSKIIILYLSIKIIYNKRSCNFIEGVSCLLDFRVETFLTVCRTMNFTRAAEELHITQPAVSHHIHTLEEEYGAKLFQYQGKQLFLTESGKLFFQTAAAMYHDTLHLKDAIRQQESRRRLRFGATMTIGEYVMTDPVSRLLKWDPEIQIRMLTANTHELLKLLDQGELEFAIVEGYFDKEEYDSLVYCDQRYIPVCAPDHQFAKPVSRLEDLLEERLMVREPGSGTRNVLERALEARNLSIRSFRHITELGNLNIIKTLVRTGTGIAFLYETAVQEELDAGKLVEIPLDDCALSHEFTFIWRKGSVFASYYQEIFHRMKGAGPDGNRMENR